MVRSVTMALVVGAVFFFTATPAQAQYASPNNVVLAPANPTYNCVSHTLGVHDRWIWPGSNINNFDRLYNSHGYQRVSGLDFSRNPQFDKVVVYGRPGPGGTQITHATVQNPRGGWTSKLGSGLTVWHPTPQALPGYGQPIAVYVRPH